MNKISNRYHNGHVSSINKISSEVVELKILIEDEFQFKPGQYVWLVLHDQNQVEIGRRVFSISSAPNSENELRLIVKLGNSEYKKKLQNLKKDEKVIIIGPFGSSFTNYKDAITILVAAGTGISPFLSILHSTTSVEDNVPVAIILFGKTQDSILYKDELLAFKNRNVIVKFEKRVDWHVFKDIPDLHDAQFYIAGPQRFVNDVYLTLSNAGILSSRMRFEAEYPFVNDTQKMLLQLFHHGKVILPSEDISENVIHQFDLLLKIIDSSTNHIVVTDYNGKVLYANAAAEKLTGFTFKEIEGNTPRLWGGHMDKLFYERLWKTKKTGEAVEEIIINRRKNGEMYYAKAHVSPIIENDTVLGWIATEEDITSFKTQQQKISKSNRDLEDGRSAMLNILEDNDAQKQQLESLSQRLSLAAKAGEIGVWEWFVEPNDLVWDDQMYALYGVSKNPTHSPFSIWRESFHPEDKERVEQEIANAFKHKQELKVTFRIIWPDKSVHYLNSFGLVIRDKDDNPLRMVGVNFDITKQKELEKVKDDFLSLASHELRTPMTAIRGLVSMILDGDYGEMNENLKEPLGDIETSAKRLINLVNDMLNVSRIEAGRLRFDLSTFMLKDTIKEACDLLKPLAQEKGLMLDCLIPDSIIVQADSEKVSQIITNLVGNSLKFTTKGGIKVEAKIEGELVTVTVTDTGIGMAEKDTKKLFNKFEQINDTSRGKTQGTGLGLYLSRAIAQKLGGDLWISWSQLGKGSTFAWSIPLANTPTAQKTKEKIDKEADLHTDQKS